MNKLSKLLKNRRNLVFIDLEGTQTSHEMIAIGALKVNLNQNNTIKKFHKPFLRYVKCQGNVGHIVEELTGLNDDFIKINGVDFESAMQDFKNYLSDCINNCIFISFGNHDLRIISQTLHANDDKCKQICELIFDNHIDFLKLIQEFVKDNEGMPYSLINYCKIFSVDIKKPLHSPDNDAINLAKLYDVFLKKRQIIIEEYKKAITKGHIIAEPIIKIIGKLNSNEDVTSQEYEQYIRGYINDKLS